MPPPLLLHAVPLAQLLPPLLLWCDAARAEQHLNWCEALIFRPPPAAAADATAPAATAIASAAPVAPVAAVAAVFSVAAAVAVAAVAAAGGAATAVAFAVAAAAVFAVDAAAAVQRGLPLRGLEEKPDLLGEGHVPLDRHLACREGLLAVVVH